MVSRPYILLLHPAFLISLFLLISNDLFLKLQFHNWFTGKLSDIAGLFAFSVFVSVLFYSRRHLSVFLAGLFFLWWKSSLSTPVIFFLDHSLHIPFHRVVDYSDYIALLVLPFSIRLTPVHYLPSLARRLATGSVGLIALISFSATSLPRKLADDNKVRLDQYVTSKKSEQQIIESFEKEGLSPRKEPAIYEKEMSYHYYLKSRDSANNTRMIPADSLYEGVYSKINYGSAYIIPEVPVMGDTIHNLRLIISDYSNRKNKVRLHSFEFNTNSTSDYSNSYWLWKKYKRPLKKKFKAILKK